MGLGLGLGVGDEGGVGVMTLPRIRVPTPGSNLSLVSLVLLISSLREMRTMVKSAPGCWLSTRHIYLEIYVGGRFDCLDNERPYPSDSSGRGSTVPQNASRFPLLGRIWQSSRPVNLDNFLCFSILEHPTQDRLA